LVSAAVRATQFSLFTGMHCATGVPFGNTPLKFASCQCAGKWIQLSCSGRNRPSGQRGERQVETVGRMREQHRVAVRRLDRPEMWNLIMKRSALNSGVPMTWLASWNPIGERTNPILRPAADRCPQ